MFFIPLDGYDFQLSLFKLVLVSYSMVKFVDDAKKFLENTVSKYTNIVTVFGDFCELLYQQVEPNIAYTEIVIRATTTRSDVDFRIPQIGEDHQVNIVNNKRLNQYRSLGTCLAFEGLGDTLNDPLTYIVPSQLNPFDVMLNLQSTSE